MAALLHNGLFGDVSYSTRLRDEVDRSMFEVPWWFRTTFRSVAGPGTHTTVCSDGIIPKADLWVNGARVAGHDVIAGAYTSNSFDVTHLVRRGTNAIAYLVYPGSPMTDLSIGWVDWSPVAARQQHGHLARRPHPNDRPGSPLRARGSPPGSRPGSTPHTWWSLVTLPTFAMSALVPDVRVTISGPTGAIELRGEVDPRTPAPQGRHGSSEWKQSSGTLLYGGLPGLAISRCTTSRCKPAWTAGSVTVW